MVLNARSAVLKITASPAKYIAPKKNGVPDVATPGSAGLRWTATDPAKRPALPPGVEVTSVTYEVGVWDVAKKEYLWGAGTFDDVTYVRGKTTTITIGNPDTGTELPISGLQAGSYTFGIREVLTLTDGTVAKSATLKLTAKVK